MDTAREMLQKMRLPKVNEEMVSKQRMRGIHIVFTDTKAIVKAVDRLFEKRNIIGNNCAQLQNRNDPRNDEGNIAIRFAMQTRSPVITELINLNEDGHEFINLISIIPVSYTNYRGQTLLTGFYSFQFPMGTVTVYRPPVALTAKEKFIPEKGELLWYRVGDAFQKGRMIESSDSTYIIRDEKSEYEYCGVTDVWPLDHVVSLREN